VLGALILLSKPIALGLFDAFVFERMRADISLSVEPVDDVQVGEVFTLTLVLHNNETHQIDGLLYVDLDKGLYDAFEPVLSQPPWVYAFDDDVRRAHKLAYEFDLPPGPTPYLLQLRALRSGRWEGVAIYYRTTSRRQAGPPVAVTITVSDAANADVKAQQ
jgi:hypothetical protein